MRHVSRSSAVVMVVLLLSALGCTPPAGPEKPAGALRVRMGAMPEASALPMWVAENQGLFEKAGLDVKIDVFQSGSERNTALTANAIDCTLVGDPVGLALMEAGGFPVSATTILLGVTPDQSPDGIVVRPGSKATSLKDLAGVPVGTSTGTHQEWVVDSLFAQAGVAAADVKKEEVKKVPIRYELLMEGDLEAAALPEPWLTLAQAEGAKLVASDTTGKNLSQDVLIASDKWLATPDGAEAMKRILMVWDQAVELVNDSPETWRDTLVVHCGLPQKIEKAYKIDTYPNAQLPSKELLEPQIEWMVDKGLLKQPVTYEDLVWKPAG